MELFPSYILASNRKTSIFTTVLYIYTYNVFIFLPLDHASFFEIAWTTFCIFLSKVFRKGFDISAFLELISPRLLSWLCT